MFFVPFSVDETPHTKSEHITSKTHQLDHHIGLNNLNPHLLSALVLKSTNDKNMKGSVVVDLKCCPYVKSDASLDESNHHVHVTYDTPKLNVSLLVAKTQKHGKSSMESRLIATLDDLFCCTTGFMRKRPPSMTVVYLFHFFHLWEVRFSVLFPH